MLFPLINCLHLKLLYEDVSIVHILETLVLIPWAKKPCINLPVILINSHIKVIWARGPLMEREFAKSKICTQIQAKSENIEMKFIQCCKVISLCLFLGTYLQLSFSKATI